MIESILVAVVTAVLSFYSGAIAEAETSGQVTKSISYNIDVNKTEICKELNAPKYPKIIY